MKKLNIAALAAALSTFTAFLSPSAKAAVYYIAVTGSGTNPNIDHADASIAGTIAWNFAQYGGYNTYVLTSTDVYYTIGSTLTMPEGAELRGAYPDDPNAKAKLVAGSGNTGIMIRAVDNCTLYHLSINGNYVPQEIVRAVGSPNVSIVDCDIYKSKNNIPSTSTNPFTIPVDAQNTDGFYMDQCNIEYAGYPTPAGWWNGMKGIGVYLGAATNATVKNSDIGSTLTSGINITGASTVLIQSNVIHDIGLNTGYSDTNESIGDGISGYHNWMTPPENFTIASNTILRVPWHHGIHVSGVGIDIIGNVIRDTYLSGIMIHDQRVDSTGGHEYSRGILVKNNYIARPLILAETPSNSNREVFLEYITTSPVPDFSTNYNPNGTLLDPWPNTKYYHYVPH